MHILSPNIANPLNRDTYLLTRIIFFPEAVILDILYNSKFYHIQVISNASKKFHFLLTLQHVHYSIRNSGESIILELDSWTWWLNLVTSIPVTCKLTWQISGAVTNAMTNLCHASPLVIHSKLALRQPNRRSKITLNLKHDATSYFHNFLLRKSH